MTVRVQIAYFINQNIERADLLFYRLVENLFGNIFTQAPLNFQVPFDAPPEIPRLQANSIDNRYNISISKNRIDLSLNDNSGISEPMAIDFKNLNQQFIGILNKEKLILTRLGLISQNNFLSEDPINQVKNRYIKTDSTSLNEITLRLNEVSEFQGIRINNNTEFAASKYGFLNPMTGVSQFKNDILVVKDINSIVDNFKTIDIEFAIKFLNEHYSLLLKEQVFSLI